MDKVEYDLDTTGGLMEVSLSDSIFWNPHLSIAGPIKISLLATFLGSIFDPSQILGKVVSCSSMKL